MVFRLIQRSAAMEQLANCMCKLEELRYIFADNRMGRDCKPGRTTYLLN